MSVRVYKVPLYCIKNRVFNNSCPSFIEYVCDIIVMKKGRKVVEVSTEYPINTIAVCFITPEGNLFVSEPWWYRRGETLCKYFVSERSFTDANMVSLNDLTIYFSDIDSKWLTIYKNELKPSVPIEQKNIKSYIKSIRGIYK